MIGNDWDEVLKPVWESPGFNKFLNKVKDEYNKYTCYPKYENIFNALKLTPYSKVKVVIIGQDPYHGEGEAHGYAFSCLKKPIPPSLKNIYKELYSDLGIEKDMTNGDLISWANQGVMLLNAGLTVEKDKPNSHKDLGWNKFTDAVISKLNEREDPVVFILWGNFAREKAKLITNPQHLVIESAHPSPFSARNGFFGSKPFSKTNEFLKRNNKKEINW